MQLTIGEKRPLAALGVGQRLQVVVDHGDPELDVALFSLNSSQKIGDDRYTVLFSQPTTPGGEISMSRPVQGSTAFDIDLSRLPATIDRMVLTATHDTKTVAATVPLVVTIGDASFNAGAFLRQEKAVKLVEIYRYKGEWRLGAVAQGFNGGLADLVRHFGGDVDGSDEPAPAAAPITPAPPRPAQAPVAISPPPPPPVPVPSPPAAPRKVSLAKTQSVSLAKTGAEFGEIILNLNWTQPRGMFSKALDLDLGCVFELDNGRCGVVQALGRSFGSYSQEPYIELSGDDRSGAVSSGETIRVNGARFGQIRRLAVFGLIYDGAPNWNATDGVITIKVPGQPEIEVRMTGGDNRKRLCGVALIENVSGQMKVTSLLEYHENQERYATSQGFKMRWQAASKD